MAHEIRIRNGNADMAFVGAQPWHGLGNQLPDGATFADGFAAAGLGYTVSAGRIYRRVAEEFVEVPGYQANVREDTGEALGVVTDAYSIIQNADAFAPLMRFDGLTFETAGVLRNGEIAWMLGHDPSGSYTVRGERIESYLLFWNSFDGRMNLGGGFTPTRVVCRNTLNVALGRGLSSGFKVPHRVEDWTEAVAKMEALLDDARSFNLALRGYGETMALRLLSPSRAVEMFSEIAPPPLPAGSKRKPETSVRETFISRCLELYAHGAGNRGESLWDWTQAAIEFADHEKVVRPRSESRSAARFASALLPGGAAVSLKQRAWNLALSELGLDPETGEAPTEAALLVG